MIRVWILALHVAGVGSQIGQPGAAPGQVPLDPGNIPPLEPIKNVIQGVYANNVTLFYRNSPYRVAGDVVVEFGATITIETGVRIYFDTGVGLKIKGAIRAVGNEFAHIQMLPYQQQINYDMEMPSFRLVDGPTVRQGRLQARFRDRWRSVCTMLTNWTSVDTGVACRSMGYTDGGFWKWFLRNNETYPFVMPQPDCHSGARNLWECPGLGDQDTIRLSENLCQGEDDIGIYCWGPPSFTGWAKHWKGLHIYNSPFAYVNSDPDMVSVNRESLSRLEFVDILFAGYDAVTKNTTAALYIEGVPPIMNGLRVERSARDGLFLYESTGPAMVTNSTFSFNRGHGIAVENTTDARVFINNTRIQGNWGDGIWYRQKFGTNLVLHGLMERRRRDIGLHDEEAVRVEMCTNHTVPRHLFFPHLVAVHLRNGTLVDPTSPPDCWLVVSLPPRLAYTYSLQWMYVRDRNAERRGNNASTTLVVCDANDHGDNVCDTPRFRVPLRDGVYPQSVAIKSSGRPIYVALEHRVDGDNMGYVEGDVQLLFRLHASVLDKAYYGLNVTHCIIDGNTGNGVFASEIRERTALSNVTLDSNQGYAGFHVRGGAADIWVNETRIWKNWGDGINVSYVGGSITINGTRIEKNRWRGAAFHFNQSLPFFAMHQEVIFKGRPSNNLFYLPTIVADNEWGGILVGNYCVPTGLRVEPKVLINWVEFVHNLYHPALEVFACQDANVARTFVDITGNRLEGNQGFGLRIAPAVNMMAIVSSNQFLNNNDTALYIRNAQLPQLCTLPANVTVSKNAFKFNRAKYIISVGLNENAPKQFLTFNQQNEVRANIVVDPFPDLPPRTTPYAAMVVSSSNVKIHRNCFKNEHARYEIAAELAEHAKWIDARENNWGSPVIGQFIDRIFDQFNRYSLAAIDIDPFMAVCNQRAPHITLQNGVFRQFRHDANATVLGGIIFENHDLPQARYTVTDDLQVVPGAKLTIAAGSVLEFAFGVGMIVQGELTRNEFGGDDRVIFTSAPFVLQKRNDIRLVDDDGNHGVTEGRLEVFVDENWGTVCNRSWTAYHTVLACNQLGLVADTQYFENWRIFPPHGDLPMVMDNIRCEENEVSITRCRHDGVRHNVVAGCRASEVVGLRCLEPRWAGVRYSLLANPPTVTGQTTMDNWVVEKGGLFNFRTSEFCPAFQIDWNYHTFHRLEVKNNFWDGVDILYNDLIKKPALRRSWITNNRRNGLKIRSAGVTVENVTINFNGQSGIRYNPAVSAQLQNDIVSWLDMREQPEQEANNILLIPRNDLTYIEVLESSLNQRKFLVAKYTKDCPEGASCDYQLAIRASGYEYGLQAKLAIQIVNPASNISDEDATFTDAVTGKSWSARRDYIHFPVVSSANTMQMRYRRTYGGPKLIVLVLFLDAQEYLDRFVHIYQSVVEDNQYGFSSVHYSNLTFADGTLSNRWDNEKLWIQKVNFSRNSEAVMWIHSPQHAVLPGTPIAEITYHLDNCSVTDNTGPLIESHRDVYASANVFHWNIWSCTFANNSASGVAVALPDTYDLLARQQHSFRMTENRFEGNDGFRVLLDGYYAFANISSNNFTDNWAPTRFGIVELRGMEKQLVCERNRWFNNWGHWMIKVDAQSHYLRAIRVPSLIQYNYIEHNHFIKPKGEYVDMWPRSYAVGVFGSQKVDVHFNRLRNSLIDFELVSGCRYTQFDDWMNVTHNWWGTGNEAEIAQRIFDFDDWNTMTLARFSPFYVSNALFINFWFDPRRDGQLANSTYTDPSVFDLKGRMYESKNMTLIVERWYQFPHYYRPYRPYRITRDVTIMPGATLRIEEGVEVHVWPNVRILVLGDLIADGSYWLPIRFKPINTTEYDEIRGRIPTQYKRKRSVVPFSLVDFGSRRARSVRMHEMRSNPTYRMAEHVRRKRADRSRPDLVYKEFPSLHREDPYYQRFTVSLTENGSEYGSGFLQIYNATTGETIPSCDRQFTVRNAQVVCRELGLETMNVYHWVTPRWDYNPRVHILKTYMEPRECRGDEPSLDRCNLRFTGNTSQWQCMDNEHFNYVYCGSNTSLSREYIGNWGGIAFGYGPLEQLPNPTHEASVLRNVEIVGGGSGHNDSWQSAGLQLFHRSPIIDHVNVTNSSMHAVQIVSPRDKIVLNNLNVTDNKGQGVSILTTFVQAPTTSQETLRRPLTIPYYTQGMLDMCAAEKTIHVSNRILIYYKYDSWPVDCVKIFSSEGRRIGFRLIQANFYSAPTDLGRTDALRIYNSVSFHPINLIAEYKDDENFSATTASGDVLALHLRATAADGVYGFIAEISSVPSSPDSRQCSAGGLQENAPLFAENVGEVVIRNSRIDKNDRGAIDYLNAGEMSPSLVIEDCSIAFNGIHLFGNISTSNQAVQLNLHNTIFLLFRSNSLAHNRGGLYIAATSSSPVARLQALVKNCLFSHNSNSTTIALMGNNFQVATLLNNVISLNYALYYDTIVAQDMAINMTRNVVFGNVGLHTVDVHANSRISSDSSVFLYNHFYDNVALGHGQQYEEKYGFLPEHENEEFLRRPRRQVLNQQGVSFDWWTHVDNETTRYRSTIIAGSAQETFTGNTFNNPRNDYELTTSAQTQYDMGTIDARHNYWGYPGTTGVAAGKIRDHSDYPYLVKVEFVPVLESNTSLVEGDCPAGWFQAGHQEFKSCFLFVASAVTYRRAVEYCEELDAFVPYMRTDDVRQKELARRIDRMSVQFVTDTERLAAYGVDNDVHTWISSVNVPSTQCAWLSARTARIGSVNCNSLLPFVCERGTQPYMEPILWRTGVVIALVIVVVLIVLLLLFAVCWWLKSNKRRTELAERKSFKRASMKLQKKAEEYDRKRMTSLRTHESTHASLDQTTISAYDPIMAPAWKRGGKDGRSPTETLKTSFSDTSDHTYSYTEVVPKKRPPTSSLSGQDYSATPHRFVSTNPNPYSDVTSSSDSKVKMRNAQLDSSLSTSNQSCSTCPSDSERTSTETDRSSYSTDHSAASESTVQNTRIPSVSGRSLAGVRDNPYRHSTSEFLASSRNFQPLPTEPPPELRRGVVPPVPATRSFVELYPPGQNPNTATSRGTYARGGRRHIVETSM